MIITGKRVINIDKYTSLCKNQEVLFVAYKVPVFNEESVIRKIGFPDSHIRNVKVLPKVIGSVSLFNQRGKDIPQKNLPKETYYRETCIKDWHGYYHYVDIPAKRYQSIHVPAPAEELSLLDINTETYILSDSINNNGSESERLKHIINLFLEYFGECTLLGEDLVPLVHSAELKRSYWQILPEGEYPWKRLNQLTGGIQDENELIGKLQYHRFETIIRHKPDVLYYGTGGFHGYLVFIFKRKNLAVMENLVYGNATYIFDNNWTEMSQKTKAEILEGQHAKYRLLHNKKWVYTINNLLK